MVSPDDAGSTYGRIIDCFPAHCTNDQVADKIDVRHKHHFVNRLVVAGIAPLVYQNWSPHSLIFPHLRPRSILRWLSNPHRLPGRPTNHCYATCTGPHEPSSRNSDRTKHV